MDTVSGRQQLVWFAVAIAVLGGIAYSAAKFGTDLAFLTRDVASTAKLHPMTGFLSNLGIAVWGASAAVCLFTGAVLRGSGGDRRLSWFFVYAGLFTAYLTLDDLLMIHDYLVERYLNLSEIVVFIGIGLALVGFLYLFHDLIWSTSFLVLVGAVLCLVASIAADSIFESSIWVLGEWKHLVEDGFKWLGIMGWAAYFMGTAASALAPAHDAVLTPDSTVSDAAPGEAATEVETTHET